VICLTLLIAGQFFQVPQLGLFVSSLAILFQMAHASSNSISEDQKNGALELLLSTTLRVDQIVDGLNSAMLRRFRAPVASVLIWPWVFIVPTADRMFVTLLVCSSILLLATWLALSWVGPWFALRKKPSAAAWTALAVVVLPPWLIWIVSIYRGLFNASYNDLHSIGAVVCSIVGVFHCVLLTRWGRDILCKNFRQAAADPFATVQFEPLLGTFGGEATLRIARIGNGSVHVARWRRTARLTAYPGEGYVFVAWDGNVRGNDNPLHLDLQGPAQIIARFARVQSPTENAG
jgi:hypothetical protein